MSGEVISKMSDSKNNTGGQHFTVSRDSFSNHVYNYHNHNSVKLLIIILNNL